MHYQSYPIKGVDPDTKVGGDGLVFTQPFPAGGLGGRCKPPAGSGAEPRRQTGFGKNLLISVCSTSRMIDS